MEEGNSEDEFVPLINALKDEDMKVRKRAAEALGRIRDERTVGHLINALTDSNEYVREYAEWSLNKILHNGVLSHVVYRLA